MNMSTMHTSVSPPGPGLGISGPGLSSATSMDTVAGGRLTALISRFLRLSALVAIELGREARGEEDGILGGGKRSALSPPPVKIPNTNPYLPANSSGSSTDGSDDEMLGPESVKNGKKRASSKLGSFSTVSGRPMAGSLRAGAVRPNSASHSNGRSTPTPTPTSEMSLHARPTRVWYALLCGLVTRACLEGYLMRGWRGTSGAEVLFRLGVRPEDGVSASGMNGVSGVDIINPSGSASGSKPSGNGNGMPGGRTLSSTEERDLAAYEARERALAAMYDPDEMPSLAEAGRILFVRGSGTSSVGDASVGEEEEWEREVRDRLIQVRFLVMRVGSV